MNYSSALLNKNEIPSQDKYYKSIFALKRDLGGT